MVHPAAWVLMGIWLMIWVALLVPAVLRKSPNPAFIPLVLTVPAVAFCFYIFMVFWVNADAKRRRMNSFQWTLIAALVPCGVGFIIYLVSRRPMPRPCSACGLWKSPHTHSARRAVRSEARTAPPAGSRSRPGGGYVPTAGRCWHLDSII